MIRSLTLEQWRAFEQLQLEFDAGTTFITAPNGVGKTSVMHGIEWAIFGELASVDVASAIRKGATGATATVELLLPGDRSVRVTRGASERRRSFEATIDDRKVNEDEFRAAVTAAYATPIDDLARLATIPAGVLVDYGKEQFHLRRHLCRLFGIDRLEAASPDIEQARKAVAAELRKVRDVRTATAAELDALAQEAADAEAAAAVARANVSAAQELAASLRAQMQNLQAVANYESRLAARGEALDRLGEQLSAVLDEVVEASTVVDRMQGLRDAAESAVEHLVREQAEIDGRLAAAAAAREQLHIGAADCPVCRRPLGKGDIANAEASHDAEAQRLAMRREEVTLELERAQERRRLVSNLDRAVRELPELGETPPTISGNRADLVARAESVEAQYREAAEAVGHADATASTLRRQLADERARLAEQQVAVRLYAKEAVLSAAADAFESVTSRLIEQRIDPLAREVARRWKVVFGGRRAGLTLDPDGRLFLERSGQEIGFQDMSAGERAVALITTRLLVLSATTREAFVCFDEPLEQLDPQNRRVVALALAHASGNAVRQVIATTFEDALVRRLEASLPHVHVKTVTVVDSDPDSQLMSAERETRQVAPPQRNRKRR